MQMGNESLWLFLYLEGIGMKPFAGLIRNFHYICIWIPIFKL